MAIEQVTEQDRKLACQITTETLGFGCTYADKRAGGKRRYKWIFDDVVPNRILEAKVKRITTEISNETGMTDEDPGCSWQEGADYKITAGQSKLTTPQSIRYSFITITI